MIKKIIIPVSVCVLLLVMAAFGNYLIWDMYREMADDESLLHNCYEWMAVWSILIPITLACFGAAIAFNHIIGMFVGLYFCAASACFATVIWGIVVMSVNDRNLRNNYYYFWVLGICYESFVGGLFVIGVLYALFDKQKQQNTEVSIV